MRDFWTYCQLLLRKWVIWLFLATDGLALLVDYLWPGLDIPDDVFWVLLYAGPIFASFQIYLEMAAEVAKLKEQNDLITPSSKADTFSAATADLLGRIDEFLLNSSDWNRGYQQDVHADIMVKFRVWEELALRHCTTGQHDTIEQIRRDLRQRAFDTASERIRAMTNAKQETLN